MDEQTQTTNGNEKLSFFEKFGWIIAASCGLIAILFLLGIVVSCKVKIDDLKYVTNIHLWDYFKGQYSYDWSMYVTLALLAFGIIFICLSKWKTILASAASMLFILAIPILALSRESFAANPIENLHSVSFGWGAYCSIAFTIAAAVLCLSVEFNKNPIVTRQIAEDGILIASAFILNLIKIPLAAGAGSVNFQMLPLFLIALRHGPAHGLVCGGVIYGLMTCLTDGYGFACYPFDYLIGFGSVMVMGFFRKFIFGEKQMWYNVKGEIFIFVAALIATLIRFIGSCASSMIVYKLTFVGALEYNALYIPISGLISVIVIMAAYGPLVKVDKMFPIQKTLNSKA